jgi:hypothetical protein
MDEHSSLLRKFVNYGQKKVYNIAVPDLADSASVSGMHRRLLEQLRPFGAVEQNQERVQDFRRPSDEEMTSWPVL